MRNKKIAILGVLLALMLIIFLVENYIPPLFWFAPYVKVGLSNVILIFVLFLFDFKSALVLLLSKMIIGGLYNGNVFYIAINLTSGLSSLVCMWLIKKISKGKITVIAISVFGACVSNCVRTASACIITETFTIFYELPIVIALSIPIGVFIGIIDTLLLNRFKLDKISN